MGRGHILGGADSGGGGIYWEGLIAGGARSDGEVKAGAYYWIIKCLSESD